MQLSFGKGLMAGAAGIAVLLAITAAANGTGVGAVFNLGETNKVDATSTLTGKAHGPMLSVANSGHGPALNLHVSSGHAPLSVNSSARVANLNASLLGGISSAGFVQGGGHMVTAQIQLSFGQQVTLFNLPGYGSFTVSCGTLAAVNFTAGPDNIHLWYQDVTGDTPEIVEQDMSAGSGLGFETGATAEQTQWTIQPDGSRLSRHLATVQTDETLNGNNTSKCDFAGVAYTAP